MSNWNFFWKISLIIVSIYLREDLRTNCVQKLFIEAFKYQKYTGIKNTGIWTIFQIVQNDKFELVLLVAKFWKKNDSELDKNVRNFSLYQK